MRSLRLGFENLPPEPLEDARAALLVVSQHLYEFDERWSQFGVEARVAWLDAHGGLEAPDKLRETLLRARDLVELLRGFHETHVGPARTLQEEEPPEEERNDHDALLGEAVKVGEAAVRALCALVDRLRAEVAK